MRLTGECQFQPIIGLWYAECTLRETAYLPSILCAKECTMLVLSRKSKQQIQIGDDITVTILQIKGQSISIGIEAPRAVQILRGELPASSAWHGDERLTAERIGLPIRSGRKPTDGLRERSQRGEMFQQDPANFHDGAGMPVHS